MKLSSESVRSKSRIIPRIRFECQALTSFAGLAISLAFFRTAKITDRIYQCFRRTKRVGAFGTQTIFVMLAYHVLMGWKRLRGIDCYRDDPLVKHVLGLKRSPDVSTVSRWLTSLDPKHLSKIRQMSRNLVIDRLGEESSSTVTVDFDGSVISTCGRTIEGTAVGFNRKKKGARSHIRSSRASHRQAKRSTGSIGLAMCTIRWVHAGSSENS